MITKDMCEIIMNLYKRIKKSLNSEMDEAYKGWEK
jgi:hypothetical protein